MVVMDAVTGKVIKDFPIGSGVDYAGFDPQASSFLFVQRWNVEHLSREIGRRV
jgi:tryptophan synthase beta subunit